MTDRHCWLLKKCKPLAKNDPKEEARSQWATLTCEADLGHLQELLPGSFQVQLEQSEARQHHQTQDLTTLNSHKHINESILTAIL
jgi:hypothetical protein